jgi:hypothetical protein
VDIERTMQFILETQARLEASVEKHDEQIATVTDLVGRLAQAEIRLVERMEALDSKWLQFLERMDRFIQGLEGDGRRPR